ncbi:hypothetical protein F2P45_26250 [Massilia sp. CCM 8733]|uniref:Uncharacterized protein n=1 Tax=Massilia mucilaginosa TaxID=2609282 RepID=A0ABX0NZY9_9BURK|nr:hypothetical protein [Massilia mucilaginosa]
MRCAIQPGHRAALSCTSRHFPALCPYRWHRKPAAASSSAVTAPLKGRPRWSAHLCRLVRATALTGDQPPQHDESWTGSLRARALLVTSQPPGRPGQAGGPAPAAHSPPIRSETCDVGIARSAATI